MLSPGSILQNRYEIINLLAQGGMGAVYFAKDIRLRCNVALKETFFTDEKLRNAFEREASLLANLRHPALPKVMDHFAEGSGQFLVMEYIPGDDLLKILEEEGVAFSQGEVLEWANQLLAALEYLHRQQPPIIHRDIKPSNIKLTEDNQVVLLDFGLAKGAAWQMSRLTTGSSVFGYTPSYAPIEQIKGIGTDPRSDLYSLGATLYHLITGETPVDALTRVTDLADGQPDPLRSANEINPQVAPAVAEALTRAMSLNRERRWASAAQMREALRQASHASAEVSEPVTHRREPERQPQPSVPDTIVAQPSEPYVSWSVTADEPDTRRAEAAQSGSGPLAETVPISPPSTSPKPEVVRRRWPIVAGISAVVLIAVVIAISLALKAGSNAVESENQKAYTETVNRVGIEMVRVPAGKFTMGSPASEEGHDDDESPQHEVSISSFYMSKYEVTQLQWRAVAQLPKVRIDLPSNPSNFKGDDLPVEQVSWEEAVEFCARLSQATGKSYRLPTEAEWEYAARAMTTGPYAGSLDSMAWYASNSGQTTHPVGTKQPNGFGLYDMHGNVWEWCNDWYSENYYFQSPSADPTGPAPGSHRVIRGGGWAAPRRTCGQRFASGSRPTTASTSSASAL